MKKIRVLCLLLWVLLACGTDSYAQVGIISATSTTANCYNDGSITISATGGVAPYTYTILSGPTGPNLSYPITLPSGNTFSNLPSGTYTI